MAKGLRTTAAKRDEARALRAQGKSYRQISEATGLPVSTIGAWFNNGVTVTPKDDPDFTPRSAQRVSVSMDAEQASRVMAGNPKLEATMVAGTIMQDSLKIRLLKQICDGGPYDGVAPLMEATRRGPSDNYGTHEVTHILYSLSKQNLVTFRVEKRGSSDFFARITATPKGYSTAGFSRMDPLPLETMTSPRPVGYSRAHHAVGHDGTEARNHGAYATGGPVTVVAPPKPITAVATGTVIPAPTQDVPSQPDPEPVAPVAASPRYPLLESLRARAAVQKAALKTAHAYYEAAIALAGIDAEESARLEQKGDEVQGAALSPTEEEYLRFAKECGN